MAWQFEEQEADGLRTVNAYQNTPSNSPRDARYEDSYRKGYMSCHNQDLSACKQYMTDHKASEQEIRQVKSITDFLKWLKMNAYVDQF